MDSTLSTSTAASAPPGPAAHTCLNCGTALHDQFCARCGQPADTHRFTLRHLLLHDLPHSIWHVDKGIGYTFRQMLARPGAALHEYMAGRRAQHFRPVTYVLLITGVSMLLLKAIQPQPIPPDAQAQIPRLIQLVMERYLDFTYKYPSLFNLVLLPTNALLAVWLLRPARFNFAETLLSQCFISGTSTVLASLCMLPIIALSQRIPHLQQLTLVAMLPGLAYTTWAYYQLLSPAGLSAASKWLRALGTSVLQTLALFITIVLFWLGLAVVLIRQDPSLLKEFQQAKQHGPAPAPRR